jgi:hypothetical protein
MVGSVFRRTFRPVAYALITAQLLLSAPMVNAFALLQGTATPPCAESMAGEKHVSECPCCPDGVQSMAGCLSACISAAAIAPSIASVAVSTAHVETRGFTAVPVAHLADPPLKPPPIV